MIDKDIVYYTDLIIDKVSEDNGYDRELVEKLFYYFSKKLNKSMKDSDDPAYYIPGFGTLYLTLTGVNYSILENNKSIDRIGESADTTSLKAHNERFERKKEIIEDYIKRLKIAGNSKIAYFDKIFNPRGIKNG